MMAVVRPEHLDEFMAVCRRWDVLATTVGVVTETGRLVVEWYGEVVVDVPPRTVAHEGPVYERPYARPGWLDARQADSPVPQRLPRPQTSEELRLTLLQLVSSPNLSSRAWVTDQYDRYVMGNTALAMPDDGGVVRIDEETGLGIALSLDAQGRYGALDPYAGAQLALVEAYRNVAATGATPLAVTDCLNFGSPEDPAVMWQFAEAVNGLTDACRELGLPVTGGNVSFYNQTADVAIHPTPGVGVLGVLDDVARRVPSGWSGDGLELLLLGTTRDELGGSEWAHVAHDHLGGLPPAVDLAAERALAGLMADAGRDGLVAAAHDLSEGGLAQALAEGCLRYGVGAQVELAYVAERDGLDPFALLFSESTARMLLAVPAEHLADVRQRADRAGVPVARIGRTGGHSLELEGQFTLSLLELRSAHDGTLPAVFGR
jgi:phosphoribosylformylglycinamidine synthase